MKRILSSVLLGALVIVSTAQPVFANFDPFGAACSQGGTGGSNTSSVCARQTPGANPVTDTILKVTTIIAIIAGIAAVIIIILAGLQFISSQGEPDKASRARQTVIGAAIGLAIIILAQSIITYVLSNVLN